MPPTLAVPDRAAPRAMSLPELHPDLVLYGVVASALAALWFWQGGFVFPLDDAYITLHNAAVLHAGADPNYGVSALVGATSLVHLALVAGLSLVLPPELASYVLSGASILLFVAGLLAMARGEGLRTPDALALAAAGLLTGALQLLNGLETGLVMAAVAWAIVLAARARPSAWLAALCGTLPFLRPELGLLSLVLMGRQAWLCMRTDAAPRAVLRDAALALAAAAPWLAWSLIETGALLPNTLAAKQAFFALPQRSFTAGLGLVVTLAIGAVGPATVALLLARRDGLVLALAAFAGLFLLGFALTMPDALEMNGTRYGYALVPAAFFALCRLYALRGPVLARVLLAAQCAIGAASLPNVIESVQGAQACMREYRAVAAWAQSHLPADSRLLVHDAGMIAYASGLPLTDLVGLKSPESVRDHRRWTLPSHSADRARAIDAIARRSGATHAIIFEDPPARFWGALADDLRSTGWHLDLLHAERANAGYRLYRIVPPSDAARDPRRTVT